MSKLCIALGAVIVSACLAVQRPALAAELVEFAPGFTHPCQTQGGVPGEDKTRALIWHRCRNTDTVIVFIHGFNSNNREAWLNTNGTFWPDLVRSDGKFDGASIVLLPFYTTLTSGDYSLFDASQGIWNELSRSDAQIGRSALDHTNIVFVAHSTGGVLLRYMLTQRQGEAKLRRKRIGLFLVASPSEGSDALWRLNPVASVVPSNKMLSQLKPGSDFLNELLQTFQNLVGKEEISRGWKLYGREFAETNPIACAFVNKLTCMWTDLMVVSRTSAMRYFPDGLTIPDKDHLSIAKPDGQTDPIHVELRSFFNVNIGNSFVRATIPIPYYYTVTQPPLAPTRPAASAGGPLEGAPLWRWTVADGKCYSAEGSSMTGGCQKQFDIHNLKERGIDVNRVVFCGLSGNTTSGSCSEVAAPSPNPGTLKVAFNAVSGQATTTWDGRDTAPISANAGEGRFQLFEVRLDRTPARVPPPAPVDFFRSSDYTQWIPRAERQGARILKVTVFPNQSFDVTPGFETDAFKESMMVVGDPSVPRQVRYRPR
ncbi:esterase/lipase family protein [Rhizobacter fulvus]